MLLFIVGIGANTKSQGCSISFTIFKFVCCLHTLQTLLAALDISQDFTTVVSFPIPSANPGTNFLNLATKIVTIFEPAG